MRSISRCSVHLAKCTSAICTLQSSAIVKTLPLSAVVIELPAVAQVIETAAPVGQGLLQLEEALLFQAELMSLQASHSRPAVGTVVEARVVKGQGAMATIIVKRGTLKACLPPPLPSSCTRWV